MLAKKKTYDLKLLRAALQRKDTQTCIYISCNPCPQNLKHAKEMLEKVLS
jgi:hypothetical protein